MHHDITFKVNATLSADQFSDILRRSGLGERRPIDDARCMKAMATNSNLLITAWDQHHLVGVARSLTDFHYACYLSDLAVDKDYHRQGLGKRLIEITKNKLQSGCKIILLSAPAATDYYPHIGFQAHDSAWVLVVE